MGYFLYFEIWSFECISGSFFFFFFSCIHPLKNPAENPNWSTLQQQQKKETQYKYKISMPNLSFGFEKVFSICIGLYFAVSVGLHCLSVHQRCLMLSLQTQGEAVCPAGLGSPSSTPSKSLCSAHGVGRCWKQRLAPDGFPQRASLGGALFSVTAPGHYCPTCNCCSAYGCQ